MADDPSGRPTVLIPYVTLLRAFLGGRLSAAEFEPLFLALFKNDKNLDRGAAFDALDRLFGAVDDYVADPDLRARTGGLSDEDLLNQARAALAALGRLEELDARDY